MTELLCRPISVRTGDDGSLTAVRAWGRWSSVVRTTNRWVVETDWWRVPVRREYRRCITDGGECLELYCDLDGGGWWLGRRHD